MYDVPGSGKHHRRQGHRNTLSLTPSDLRWGFSVALLPATLGLEFLFLPDALVAITVTLVVALGALTIRLTRQSGDRHYPASPKSGKVDLPVQIYEVKVLPSPEEVEAETRRKVRTAAIMMTISAAVLAFARHSGNQADKSRKMHDEVDEALGLPGTRLGYGAQYHANRLLTQQQWVQPPITGWNWRQRLEEERKRIREDAGEPGDPWQTG